MANRPRTAYQTSSAVLAALLLVTTGYTLPLSAAAPADPPEPPSTLSGTDIPADWWAEIQADIQRAEYDITWQDQTYLADLAAAYQAPNRAQGLRTYFAPAGPIVIPREWADGVTSPPWRLDLRLAAWGRASNLEAPPAASPESQANRVEYRRGALVEWYRNDEEGLTLGLRLGTAPDGDPDAPVRITLAWDGGLTAVGGDGTGAAFQSPEGVALQIGPLAALDAVGRLLGSRLSVEEGNLVLEVEDAGASYPVEVTAVVTSPAGGTGIQGTTGLPLAPTWTMPWTEANASFGFSVATAGDVDKDGCSDIIVGAHRFDGGLTDEGKAFVYLGHGSGAAPTYIWSKEADQAGAQYGYSVGTAGDVNGDGFADIIVGAPYWDSIAPEADEGGVWVYQGSYLGPHSAPDFFAQSNQTGALLGKSVAFAGNVNGDGWSDIIVGAPSYNNGAISEGVALVWHGSESGVNGGVGGTPGNADWRAESNQTSAMLGSSVATAGDVNADGYADVIVGGFQYGADSAGAAWVWHGSSSGINLNVDGRRRTPYGRPWARAPARTWGSRSRPPAT